MTRSEARIREAIANGQVRADVDPYAAALGLWAIVDGLLRAWLLDQQAFDLIKLGAQVIDTHLDSLRKR
jgi:TetR/AcrR family acrAB operon transcriptional repressor